MSGTAGNQDASAGLSSDASLARLPQQSPVFETQIVVVPADCRVSSWYEKGSLVIRIDPPRKSR